MNRRAIRSGLSRGPGAASGMISRSRTSRRPGCRVFRCSTGSETRQTRMSVGRMKLLLGSAAAALLLAGGLAITAAALWPLADDAAAELGADDIVGGTASQVGDPLPLASFARAWSL